MFNTCTTQTYSKINSGVFIVTTPKTSNTVFRAMTSNTPPATSHLQHQIATNLLSTAPNLSQSQIKNLISSLETYTSLTSIWDGMQMSKLTHFFAQTAMMEILNDSVPFRTETRQKLAREVQDTAPNSTANQIEEIISAAERISLFMNKYLTHNEVAVMAPSMAQLLIDYRKSLEADSVATSTEVTTENSSTTRRSNLEQFTQIFKEIIGSGVAG